MSPTLPRAALPTILACLALQPLAGLAADTAEKAPAKASARTPAPTPATSHQQLRSQAKGMALAAETVQRISEAQLAVADRVLTGPAACEFDQTVHVDPIHGRPGHFRVGFKKAVYTMVPQETTTGAVRLEDKKAGVVWLQIPVKSMLMNQKIGQRLVDACMHSEQRAAVAAAAAAGQAASAPDAKN
jgi:hypothetical protein